LRYGKADEVIEYSPKDIEQSFIDENSEIFSIKRGAGLWLWKPYLILKTLESLSDGEYLMYTDSGSFFCGCITSLIDSLEKSAEDRGIMCFELPLFECEWTKRETMQRMGYKGDKDHQILGSYILMRKCDFVVNFIKEWLDACKDIVNLHGDNYTDLVENSNFVAHREDQSVLSILCHNYGIQPFRDPSQYGDYPWEYASNKGSKKRWSFEIKEYPNSPFGRIIVSNRKIEPIKFYKRLKKKDKFNKFGLYNKWIFKMRWGAFYGVLE